MTLLTLLSPPPSPQSDTGAGVDTAVVAAALSSGDTSTGTDAGVVAAALSSGDTASGADTGAVVATSSSGDTVAGTEAGAVAAVLASSDTGAGVDAASVAAAFSSGDTGSGADAGSLAAAPSQDDTGSGSDTAQLAAAASGSDTGSVVDTEELAVAVSAADSGVVLDSGLVFEDSHSASDADTGALGDLAVLAASPQAADVAGATDAGSVVAALPGSDTFAGSDLASLATSVQTADVASGGESASLGVQGTDTFVGSDTAAAAAQASTSDTFVAGEDASVVESVAAAEVASTSDAASLSVSLPVDDSGTVTEDAQAVVSVSLGDTVSAAEDAEVLVSFLVGDSGTFTETAVPALPPPPVSVFDHFSPSVVEVLRPVTTRVNGSLSVTWRPISEIVGGHLRSHGRTLAENQPVTGGQLVVRFDLGFVRLGGAQAPPPNAPSRVDRTGIMFADRSAVEYLRAGDRVRCTAGPISGTFEVRVIPDIPIGYSAGHHLEVEVVEVSQPQANTWVTAPKRSRIRHLYASRVEVLRNTTAAVGGSVTATWTKITDICDITWGEPGEMWCRLNLNFVRPGKDQLPPWEAGRAPDRVGVLFCDITPHLQAGDRLKCVQGDVTGLFELRIAPDSMPDYSSVSHLEVQVIEVAQSLANVYPRAEAST